MDFGLGRGQQRRRWRPNHLETTEAAERRGRAARRKCRPGCARPTGAANRAIGSRPRKRARAVSRCRRTDGQPCRQAVQVRRSTVGRCARTGMQMAMVLPMAAPGRVTALPPKVPWACGRRSRSRLRRAGRRRRLPAPDRRSTAASNGAGRRPASRRRPARRVQRPRRHDRDRNPAVLLPQISAMSAGGRLRRGSRARDCGRTLVYGSTTLV
jgi:hypothetical protein